MADVRILAVVVLVQWIPLSSGSCESGMFGDSCSHFCHCGTSCDETTGACSGDCDTGWRKAGGLCQKQNIAQNKTTSTTSGSLFYWPASQAVDGDSDIRGESRTCFHAARSPSDWTVDLGRDFQLYDIRIYSRNGSCSNTTYGINCNKTCAERKCSASTSSCDRHTGGCDTGCLPGWTEDDCTQECSNGRYGVSCSSLCSNRHCAGTSSCDHVTGSCDSGCQAGWMGVDCKEACDSNHYGPGCLGVCSSRHCVGNSSCDSTGTCDSGCLTGWTRDDCAVSVFCPPGRYGSGCTEFCSSRNCKTSTSVCDVTGSCPDGCREGWQNADCRITCQSGRYGSNCSKSCDSRHCQTAPVSCDHVTGACGAGCQEGWIGADCIQRCKPGRYGPDCTRCGHCDVTCNIGDGRCPGECLDGFTGDRCDEDVRVSPVTSGVIGGAVAVVVMLLLIGGLTICLLKSGRLKWISSSDTGVRNTDSGGTGEIPSHANTSGTNEQDYTELSEVTREREEKSQYDVIQNKVYENNQMIITV